MAFDKTSSRIATVVMPERGRFLVRVGADGAPAPGAAVLVSLDYGVDMGRLVAVEPYDAKAHGAHVPNFQLMRAKTEADDAVLEANAARANELRHVFANAARSVDLRVPYARLSYGRTRLFLRYCTGEARIDLRTAIAAVRRVAGDVTVNAWQMGPRDEMGLMGGFGPCGRPCCCATWQQRYPAGLSTMRLTSGSKVYNGTCGRIRCCLAFETAPRGHTTIVAGTTCTITCTSRVRPTH